MKSLLLLVLTSTLMLHASETPVVLWSSSPVQPGETVLVHGGNFCSNSVVELKCGWKKATLSPISVSDTSLMFVYPESWKSGVLTGTIKSGDLTSKPFQINAPSAWWIHGDRNREASVISGSISIFGNCLADSATDLPKVSIKCIEGEKKGKKFSLKTAKSNRFSVRCEQWKQIPAGLYEVTLKRNRKTDPVNAGTIRVSAKTSFVAETIFDITKYGAIPNDGIDDTAAILAAVKKLTANKGGVLFVPRGRYQMTETIELPPGSALRGVNARDAQIYWPDSFEPLDALVKGTHSFEVSDIFLTCANHKDGIVGNWPQPRQPLSEEEKANYKCGNISIRNITLRMLYSQYVNSNMDELKRRIYPIHYARALRLGGENINVTGNDIYCAAGGVFEIRAYWSNFSDNILSRGNIIGWNGYSGQQLVIENNHLGGANCTSFYGLPEGSENIYWGNNYHENNFDGNNRETITGDGRVHAYMDTVTDITPTSFTLKDKPKWRYGIDAWKNGAVQIAGGKGAGQIRRIKSVSDTKIEVVTPWAILPDETSVFNISSFRRRFIYTENKAYDSTVALQLYGSMIEGIIAGNVTSRTGGYNGDAMSGEANWFNQFFNNTIETGNSYRGPRNQVPALDAQLGLLAYGAGTGSHKYPLVRSCVVRNNKLESNAHLTVSGWVVDSLLEKNTIENADKGAIIADAAKNIVLRNNTFNAVDKPYEYKPESVVINPAEELLSAIKGTASLMGWDSTEKMPVEWQKILSDEELSNASPEEIANLWNTMVKSFASFAVKPQNCRPGALTRRTDARWGTGPTKSDSKDAAVISTENSISDKVVETLLGFKVETPNWRTVDAITLGTKAAEAPLQINISNCRIKSTLKLALQSGDSKLEGWTFTLPEIKLEPGKSIGQNATIAKPDGHLRMVKIPLVGKLTGDGWKLSFTTSISDRWETLPLDKFRISKPLDNPLGKQSHIGYIKHSQMPKVAADQLIEAPTEHGRFAFAELYKDAADKGKLIYGTTTLKLKNEVKVRFEFNRNALLYVNGRIVGTTLSRGQWGFVTLQAGENRIETLMQPSSRDKWKFSIPSIKWADQPLELE